MCLPIDCWLCTPRTDDDHYHAPPTKHGAPPPSRGQPAQRNGGHHYNGNGGHYYNGNSYPAHGAAAGAEADRKVSNDVRRGPAYTVAAGAGAAATGTQEKADGTLKPPAGRNGTVAAADGARGVAHNYYEREQPAHREDAAAADLYHHPPATATADHESPSICSRHSAEAPGGESRSGARRVDRSLHVAALPCPLKG
ncbi:uncharacterized protein [Miscanthus floridulus]|uniref:uncharacterized protein n=1 Tax=Miscanthus floridulus TaxID=154761 RepID=UPI00345A4B90